MGTDEFSNLFLRLTAKKGEKFAERAVQSERYVKIQNYLNKIVEFISVNLQAEFSRIVSCSALGQLSTHDIGHNLKNIIEEHIEKAIFLIEKERETDPGLINNIIPDLLIKLNTKINEKENTKNILDHIFDLNLFHDFGNVVSKLCDFDTYNVDLLLRYLVVLHIQRRLARREIMPR